MSESAASYRCRSTSKISAFFRRCRPCPSSRAPRWRPSSMGMLNRGMPPTSTSTLERSWIAQSHSPIILAILPTRISALSVASNAHLGWYPEVTIVKTIARSMGLNPSSNGQFMNTDLAARGLNVRRLGTRLPGIFPQRVADGFRYGGASAGHRRDLYATVNHRSVGRPRTPRTGSLFRHCHHPMNMRCCDPRRKANFDTNSRGSSGGQTWATFAARPTSRA